VYCAQIPSTSSSSASPHTCAAASIDKYNTSTVPANPNTAAARTGATSNRRRNNNTATASIAATAASTRNTSAASSSAGVRGSAATASRSHYRSAAAVDSYIALLTEQLDDDEHNSSKQQQLNGFQITAPPSDDPFEPAAPGCIMNDVEQTSQRAIWDGLTEQLWHTSVDTSTTTGADCAGASAAGGTSPAIIAT
jgi:hypothetical protein